MHYCILLVNVQPISFHVHIPAENLRVLCDIYFLIKKKTKHKNELHDAINALTLTHYYSFLIIRLHIGWSFEASAQLFSLATLGDYQTTFDPLSILPAFGVVASVTIFR